MITKIKNAGNGFAVNKSSIKKNDFKYSNITLEKDIFLHNISFKGIQLPSGEYEKSQIEFAKDKLNETDESWKLDLYRQIYSELKANRPQKEFIARNGQHGTCDMNNPLDRIVLGILSFGLNEIEVQLENLGYRNEARDKVRKMDILRADLQNIKLKEEVAQMKKTEQLSEHKVNYLKEMNEVKEKQLKPKLLDLIQREREGRPTDMPNCILLSNPDNSVNEELIKWASENVNGKFVSIKSGDGIVSYLEQAEEDYQQTGDWNLMYIKDMDKLIDHNEVNDRVVEGMKDIMSATAEDYHTTIIFSSTHPEQLDKIALQPHRVKRISTDKIVTPQKTFIEDAKERLKEKNYVQKTPISAINDLLIVAGTFDNLKLDWNHTPEQVKVIDALLKNKFDNPEEGKYLKLYEEAKKYLV